MRMPILSYVLIVGTALLGLLFLLGNDGDPGESALKTSQLVGVPKPFKALPEAKLGPLMGVNFAAQREAPRDRRAKSAKVADTPARQRTRKADSMAPTPVWKRFAESPQDNLAIH